LSLLKESINTLFGEQHLFNLMMTVGKKQQVYASILTVLISSFLLVIFCFSFLRLIIVSSFHLMKQSMWKDIN